MSLSDFSDLTDLSSDEDDVPLAQRTTAKKTGGSKKTPKEYKISNVLRPPRTTQYTAKSLYDQIIDNAIDLDPEYQRDVVWPESKQSGLIDSILRNYYMPPIIFAVSVSDDGSELRTCIDGKQRLTSIQRFIDGQIPHKDSFTNEKLWFKGGTASQRRKLLPKHLMTQFANKQIVCVEYNDLNEDQEREIFQRVQLGVALTPAERMQAIVGPWPSLIREIQSQVLGEGGFQGYLDWGHARGRDFQCLASIGFLIENLPKHTFPGAPQLEKWLQNTEPVAAKRRAELTDTFRILVTLARDKKYSGSLNKPTRVSPIEFVMIGVLIYLHRAVLSLTQLSSAIEKMRADVRSKHVDIRANTRITKHMLDFISKKLKVSQLKSDGNDKPAASKVPSHPASKRKRPVDDDSDGGEDDDSQPPTRKTTNPKRSTKSTPSSSHAKGSTKSQPLGKQTPSQQKTAVKGPSPPAVSTISAPAYKAPPQTGKPTVRPIKSLANSPSTPTHPPAAIATHVAGPSAPCQPIPTVPPPIPPAQVPPPFRGGCSSKSLSPAVSVAPSTGPLLSVKTEVQNASLNMESDVPSTPRIGSSGSGFLQDRLAPIRAAKAAIQSGSSSQAQSPAVGNVISRASTPSQFQPLNSALASQTTYQASRPPPVASPPAPMGQEIDRASIEAILRAAGIHQGQPLPNPGASSFVTPGSAVMANGNSSLVFGTPPLPGAVPLFAQGFANGMQAPSSSQVGAAASGVVTGMQNLYLSQHPSLSQHIAQVNTSAPGGYANGSPSISALPSRPAQLPLPPISGDHLRADPIGGSALPPPPKSASSTGSFPDERRNSDYDQRGRDYRRSSASYDKSRDRERYRDRSGDRDRYDRRDSSNWERDRRRDGGWGSRGRGLSSRR